MEPGLSDRYICIMVGYILIIVFLFLILWILLCPVILFLDTDRNRYFISLPGVFKVILITSGEIIRIRAWIFFIPFTIHPFRMKRKRRGKKSDKPVKKRRRWRFTRGTGLAGMLRAFRIRRLELNLDTDDFSLNAWLVPVFSVLNSRNIRMKVNFEGTSSMLLDLRFRLGALLWILVTIRYRSMFNL
jgi:hypothetical protein